MAEQAKQSPPLTMSPEREAQMRSWDTNQELWNEIDAQRAANNTAGSLESPAPTDKK